MVVVSEPVGVVVVVSEPVGVVVTVSEPFCEGSAGVGVGGGVVVAGVVGTVGVGLVVGMPVASGTIRSSNRTKDGLLVCRIVERFMERHRLMTWPPLQISRIGNGRGP